MDFSWSIYLESQKKKEHDPFHDEQDKNIIGKMTKEFMYTDVAMGENVLDNEYISIGV